MKILLVGGNGQIGSDCRQVLGKSHEILAPSSRRMDISDFTAVKDTLSIFKPDIILNCAAYTNVDACETQRELAWKVNVDGPRNLISGAKEFGGLLVHVSTDYVFNGKKKVPEPYREDDDPDPISYYGRTKLAGEEVIRQATDHHIILRTAWIYGIRGRNFLKTMLKLALKNPEKEIKVVNDQFGSPTWSYRLALQIEQMIGTREYGTYHATSEGYCTWFELAVYFLKKMEVSSRLTPCTTDEYPTPAVRPQNSILENKRLKRLGINRMPHWQKDVDQFVLRFRGDLIQEGKRSTL